LQIKTKIVSCDKADSKPVKQEVDGTVILPPLVFPDYGHEKFYNIGPRSFEIQAKLLERSMTVEGEASKNKNGRNKK
jgi:hypothetical protein